MVTQACVMAELMSNLKENPMRKFLFGVLTLALVLGVAGRATAQDDPKEVIKKAVAAHGGAEKLDKFKASRSTGKGTISIMGLELEFTAESSSQLPDKQKTVVKMDVMGQPISVVQLVNGEKMSLTLNGMSVPAPDAMKEELKEAVGLMRASTLTPLLNDAGYELKAIPGIKVDGNETVGVEVSGHGLKEVKFYFDKKSNLLVKMERKGLDPTDMTGAGNEVLHETFLSDYKDTQGVKRPTKTILHVDGKKYMETISTKIELLEKLDDSEFAD